MEKTLMKTTRIAKNKKLLLGLSIAAVLVIIILALSMSRITTNASVSNFDDYLQPNTAHAVRYHIQTDNELAITYNLDQFLHNASCDTPIKVFFELSDCLSAPINPAILYP